MAGQAARDEEVRLVTPRLVLRPWRVDEAAIHRELWLERDPRVPAHRRVDANGRPSLADLEDAIRRHPPSATSGLLALERREAGDVIGYCGLIDGTRQPDEPELGFELLRRSWGHGYATEASWAVLDWARSSGYPRLWATVWDWNTASRRVLAKLGFVETAREETVHGTKLTTVRQL